MLNTFNQVPKHLGKVDGECTFGGLHTVTNEYGEVRAMTLTATKSHDQFMPALSMIPHSLHKYGHDDVQLVFTDNVHGDKAELERVFPSLLCQVVPVPPSSLPAPTCPPEWRVEKLETPFQINSQLNSLMESLSDIEVTQSIHLAMDMEWSVDIKNGTHGRVALIQIAYDKCIYLTPVCVLIYCVLKFVLMV